LSAARVLIVASILLFATAPARAQAPSAFQQRCVVCHQATGAGIPGAYPPIAGTLGEYVKNKQGRTWLVHLLLYGMSGPMSSQGATYNGLMPPAKEFSDEELADAINYVLHDFNAKQLPRHFKALKPAEFKAARATPMTPIEVFHEREKLLSAIGKPAEVGQR
jgi:mono/diheme cytochrome c family protein